MTATVTKPAHFDPREHEWVVRQYGDKSPEPYAGPGDFDTIRGITSSWNHTVDEWNKDGGRRPAYYMERTDMPPRRL